MKNVVLATADSEIADNVSLDAIGGAFHVGHVVASLDLKYGGPSRSVLALARAQARAAAPVALATLGEPMPELWSHPGLTVAWSPKQWPERLACSRPLRAFLEEQAFATLHQHGLWLRPLHYAYRAARARGVPLVVSPRGMMSRWSWQRHRRRKTLASLLVHPGALQGTSAWHATSEDEADEIRALGFRQPICVAPNGIEVPNEEQLNIAREHWYAAVPEARQRPVAVFFSRFHSKKRIIPLIDAWMAQAPKDWLLLLVGLPDEYSARELNGYVLKVLGRERIRVFDGTQRPPPYAIASLFLLPSHSENFGLAIAEALAARVPVLVTDTTPWAELNEVNAGWCVSWTDYARTLRTVLTEPRESLAMRGQLGRTWVRERFSWDASARQLIDFYATLPAAR